MVPGQARKTLPIQVVPDLADPVIKTPRGHRGSEIIRAGAEYNAKLIS